MAEIIYKLSEETGKKEKYEVVLIDEDVLIKNQKFNVKHEYYKKISSGELFAPFDDPDKNLDLDFEMYRVMNGLLSSLEIKRVRNSYKLSIRDFANILGVSYSTLSSVENGSLQSEYLNTLIELVSDPYAFKKLVIKYQKNKNILAPDKYEALCGLLNKKVVYSYEEHEAIAKKIDERQTDLHNELIVIDNKINYDISIHEKTDKKGSEETWVTSVTRSIKKVLPKLFPIN